MHLRISLVQLPWQLYSALRIHDTESPRASPRRELACIFPKKKRIGAMRWRALKPHIRCSPENIQGTVPKMAHGTFSWAVNANWNSDNRYWNVEANPADNPNRWNKGNQFFSCYYFLSGRIYCCASGFICFCSKPFFQPPTIFPKSSISAAREIYCGLEISRSSHNN